MNTNNNISGNDNNYIVSYLDFLGSKDRIKHEGAKKIFEDLTGAFKYAKEEAIKKYSPKYMAPDGIHIRTFSDNVFIYSKLSKNENLGNIWAAFFLFYILSFLEYSILKYGYLQRGCILTGELHINEHIIIGDSLIKAYDIEHSVATTPRIIVSNELKESLDKTDIMYKLGPAKDIILLDSDGKWTLNYLYDKNKLIDYKRVFEKCFLDAEDMATEQKIIMAIAKFNMMCIRHSKNEQQINISALLEDKIKTKSQIK